MMKILSIAFVLFCATSLFAQKPSPRLTRNFDEGWKFSLGVKSAAQGVEFNDESWRTLRLPHDWSIEGEYSLANGTDWQSGYLPAGIGWYRKTFDYDPAWQGKVVSIKFDGIFMNSDVWINGTHLGNRPNGSIGFQFELQRYLKPGKNVIAVKVDQSKPLSARWYTGAGIYRHVWLVSTPLAHLNADRLYVRSTISNLDKANFEVNVPVVTAGKALTVKTTLSNSKNKKLVIVESAANSNTVQSFSLNKPNLWSPESPYLYNITMQLLDGKSLIDQYSIPVGVRKTEFSGDYGFKLNNVITKLKGVCMHEDAGALGTAVPEQVLLRRLIQLKEMGVNAVRTSHNPFSPQFYAMCDSLGLMVLNEAFDGWETEKAADDYGNYFEKWWKTDLSDFIYRDRNHPSVIMWSIGNEVRKPTLETQQKLIDLIHELDPGRPVTQGGVDPTRGMTDKLQRTLLDIKGFNGDGEEMGVFEEFHKEFPDVPMIGTEVPHTYQTRGVYRTQTHWRRRDFPAPWEINAGQAGTMKGITGKVYPVKELSDKEVFPEEKTTVYYKNDSVIPIPDPKPWTSKLFYQSSYDNALVRTTARKAWQHVMELPYVMGEFRWTAFDYLGESNQWPSRFANFGVIDLCGFPKDHFYLYQSLWTEKPMVHLLPHWTHPGKEGIEIPMVVYTNCDSADLVLNGKSLGVQKYVGEQLVWNVPYTPGTIKAISYKNGKQVATDVRKTAGTAAGLEVKTNKKQLKADGKDLLICEITVVDKDGTEVPLAGNMLNFNVNGPATIKAVDNGDPLDLSSYQSDKRRAFRGKCLLILEASKIPGSITVQIKSQGLETEEFTVRSRD